MSKTKECFAYNTKIIETPTTKEVYIYENPIFIHSKEKVDLQYSYLSIFLSVLEKQKLSVGKILTTITGLYIFTDRRPVNVH